MRSGGRIRFHRTVWAGLAALVLWGAGCQPAAPEGAGSPPPPAAPSAGAGNLAAGPQVGPAADRAAPPVAGVLADTGDSLKLSDLQGKVVFLNFFATWCGPCRMEMPEMQALHEELGDRVAIVAVGADPGEGPEQLAAFAAELGLTFPVLYDGGEAAMTYQVIGIPTSLFIDRAGIIRARADHMLDTNLMLMGLEAANH